MEESGRGGLSRDGGSPQSTAGLFCSRHFLLNKSSASQLEAPVGALLTPDLPSCHLQHLFVTPASPGVTGPEQDAALLRVVSFPQGLHTAGRAASLPTVPTRCPTSRQAQPALAAALQRGLNALVYMELISRFQTCFQAGLALFSCKRRPTPCCRQGLL